MPLVFLPYNPVSLLTVGCAITRRCILSRLLVRGGHTAQRALGVPEDRSDVAPRQGYLNLPLVESAVFPHKEAKPKRPDCRSIGGKF